MTQLSKRIKVGLIGLVCLALGATTCQAQSPVVNNNQVTSVPAMTAENTEAAIQQTTTETLPPSQGSGEIELSETSFEFGPGTYYLDDPSVGLDQLSSYRATLVINFQGSRNGQAEEWSKSLEMTASRGEEPFRQVNFSANGADADQHFMADANRLRYEKIDSGECSADILEDYDPIEADWEPAQMLFPLQGVAEAQVETINGIEANHYAFDASAMGESKLVEAQGEIWVAVDGGYVVKYTVTKKGGEAYFGPGLEGSITWDYSLNDIDQPVALELPEGCPMGLVEAPMMPDAIILNQFPGITNYSTTASLDEIMAFYAQELPALGWEVKGESSMTDTIGLSTYTLGDQQLTIVITPIDSGRSVWLSQGLKLAEPPPEG
jgi:hypothetical protein